MLTWSDVAKVHQTWKGVYSRDGLVMSLLCNPHSHGDQGDDVWENSVAYRVSFKSHAGDANALKRTMAAQRAIRMFEKLGKNQWVDRGLWTIKSFVEEADGLCFSLTRSDQTQASPGPRS